jgi:hypothetical protein
MSNLCPHQVVSNANSKMCQIDLLVEARHRPVVDRMVEITRLADEFRAAVAGSTTDPFREVSR